MEFERYGKNAQGSVLADGVLREINQAVEKATMISTHDSAGVTSQMNAFADPAGGWMIWLYISKEPATEIIPAQ